VCTNGRLFKVLALAANAVLNRARYPADGMPSVDDVRSLSETDLEPEPHRQFQTWFQEAVGAGEPMPGAMALATVSADGWPSVRMMMLEDVDERGFAFQTNLASPKAQHLSGLGRAALAFFWPTVLRQVRVTGSIEPLTREEVAGYYARLPSGVHTMLQACRQSHVIGDRSELEAMYAAALEAPTDGIPADWGGYRLQIETIEFWQGRPNWLQDRLRYTRTADGDWRIERLVP
jgi:pyridoxamine 5'-phosphate oxidase